MDKARNYASFVILWIFVMYISYPGAISFSTANPDK